MLTALAMTAALAGCQAAYEEAMTPQTVAYHPVAPDGRSGQRLGPDGYPMLGAYPDAAAPQVDDATVAAQRRRAAALAGKRGGAASTRGYDAEIARLKRLKRRQAEEVDAALARKPESAAVKVGSGQAPSRTPEEVLRQIQTGQ
ncbi:hypothetical protein [Jiella sonneratiae]|uniref:DUF3035 domain-containing protein n=1 Tax=Jiella sonneratiae TaxID=2816856 RepID=A0ABS3IYU0_9HYPH|nr:hypothetical protein [Jiella sonneratiae]MBO0902570.1 hypothetical protein [Jiella sonneratiae]